MTGAAIATDTAQNVAAGEAQAKQLLLPMDKHKNGKVSPAQPRLLRRLGL